MLPMYMGVILIATINTRENGGAPHVYGGDPCSVKSIDCATKVLPMYMGVIPVLNQQSADAWSAPHVYGGDPNFQLCRWDQVLCSPCIWG